MKKMYFGDDIREIIPFSVKLVDFFTKVTITKIILVVLILIVSVSSFIYFQAQSEKQAVVDISAAVGQLTGPEIGTLLNDGEGVENQVFEITQQAIKINKDQAVVYAKYTRQENGEIKTSIKVIHLKKTEDGKWTPEAIEDLTEENLDKELLVDLCNNLEDALVLDECKKIKEEDDNWLQDPCASDADCPNDSVFCNGLESCDEERGYCVHGEDPCQDSGLFCDPTNKVCVSCRGDSQCADDGIFCNGEEVCDGGFCVSSQERCTEDNEICREAEGKCQIIECQDNSICDDGLSCNGLESCVGGYCQAGIALCTDDGLLCNGIETCSEVDGCASSGDPCTSDLVCDEGLGCAVCFNNTHCEDDQQFCTGDEICLDNFCQSVGDPCLDDGLYCNGTESCDEDGNSCVSSDDVCSDQLCNEVDQCYTLACQSDQDCLDDNFFCNGDEVCNLDTNTCINTADPCSVDKQCNEGTDSCDECLYDVDCLDSNFCNNPDSCVDGNCQHEEAVCSGAFCDEDADQCLACLYNSDCDDNLYCNGVEVCQNGDCVDGIYACPDQLCNESDRCYTQQCQNDQDCSDDLLYCSGLEVCNLNSKTCVHEGDPCPAIKYCNDITDSCDECQADANCVDNQFCNNPDTCASGNCQHAGIVCVGEGCNEATDQCVECLLDTDCPDNNDYCDGEEVCNNNKCESEGSPCSGALLCDEDAEQCVECLVDLDCDDGKFCTIDSCAANLCSNPARQCVDDTFFCNGIEECDEAANKCSSPYGSPCNPGFQCLEASDTCVCADNTGCPDNGNWCDGNEFCDLNAYACTITYPDVGGRCVPPKSSCDETNDMCFNPDACDEGAITAEMCVGAHTLQWQECIDEFMVEQTRECEATRIGNADFSSVPGGWEKTTVITPTDQWIQYEKDSHYVILWQRPISAMPILAGHEDELEFILVNDLKPNATIEYIDVPSWKMTLGGIYDAAYISDATGANKEIVTVITSCSLDTCRNFNDTYIKIILWEIGGVEAEVIQILNNFIVY